MDGFSDAELHTLAAHIADTLSAKRQDRSAWDRRINLITGLLAVIGIVFSAGINWSRLGANEQRISDEVKAREALEVRVKGNEKDIAELRTTSAVVLERLTTIQLDIAQIKGILDHQR